MKEREFVVTNIPSHPLLGTLYIHTHARCNLLLDTHDYYMTQHDDIFSQIYANTPQTHKHGGSNKVWLGKSEKCHEI